MFYMFEYIYDISFIQNNGHFIECVFILNHEVFLYYELPTRNY